MKKSLLLIILLNLSFSVHAQMPGKGFYGGLGATFNIVKFTEADANTLGLSKVFINGQEASEGYAGGPYAFPESSENRFGPTAQIGYYNLFKNSKWLWGSKFTYNYIGSTATSTEISIPQYGSNSTGMSFTGVAEAESFQYSANHQMTLIPYLGYSTRKAFFYLGVGPSLTETVENINGVIGYAFIQNNKVNITGAPTDFSSTNWVFGLAATAGGTVFITPMIFLDFSYVFNPTSNQTNDFLAPFSNSNGMYSTSGDMIGSTSSKETTNSFSLTINKIF